MKPWLHFTGGDYLYFKSCQPASNGAIAGACIALVCLALLERFTVAFRSVMEARWRHSTLATPKNHSTPSEQHYDRGGSCDNDAIQLPQQPRSTCPSRRQSSQRLIAPFILAHDIQRGGMYAIQALLGYALMLAAMTFQAAYLMSIILGLGIGEVMFRRMESVITYALH